MEHSVISSIAHRDREWHSLLKEHSALTELQQSRHKQEIEKMKREQAEAGWCVVLDVYIPPRSSAYNASTCLHMIITFVAVRRMPSSTGRRSSNCRPPGTSRRRSPSPWRQCPHCPETLTSLTFHEPVIATTQLLPALLAHRQVQTIKLHRDLKKAQKAQQEPASSSRGG